MLTLFSRHAHPNCDGIGRRDFLKIGGLGLGGFGLPQLPAARAPAAKRRACGPTSGWTALERMVRRFLAQPTRRSERTTKPRRICRCERRSNESKIAARCSKALIRFNVTRIARA